MYFDEIHGSRGGAEAWDGSTGRRLYIVQTDANEDELEVREFAAANSPASVPGPNGRLYYRTSINTREKENGIYEVEVNYVQPKQSQLSGQTGGGSEKVEYSLETQHSFDSLGKDTGFAPDFHQGINVTKTNVEGVNIRTAAPAFKLTQSWALNEIDGSYFEVLERLTGTVNQADVTLIIDVPADVGGGPIEIDYKAGELLFLGADFQLTAEPRLEATYNFEVSRGIYEDLPATHRNVGELVITDKEGWDLIWIYSEETADEATKTIVRQPVAAYVERVYRRTDFAELRIM